MEYRDTFSPRPAQAELLTVASDNHAAGRKLTVAYLGPGTGKTLAAQALATTFKREGWANYVLWLAPRRNLTQQVETSWRYWDRDSGEWRGDFLLFDERCRLTELPHQANKALQKRGGSVVTTYQSTATAPSMFMAWAKDHSGDFLLVVDEAQFCGAPKMNDEDGESGGTVAGDTVRMLHEFAAHTLLMTGTPTRCDGRPLVLARESHYTQPDDNGRRHLVPDVESGYRQGVTHKYLRRFELGRRDADVRVSVNNIETKYTLSRPPEDDSATASLSLVLSDPNVWQPMVDDVVAAVRRKQRRHPSYRGLIACINQTQAREVHKYLRKRHPGVAVLKAVSEDPDEASRNLAHFRDVGGDVLVTCRMAFLGYDCPEITVVGVLTNYRDAGHLMQLVGRGMRVWKGDSQTQSVVVVAPDDRGMEEFLQFLRDESQRGIRDRTSTTGGGSGDAPDYDVEAAATQVRWDAPDGQVSGEQVALLESARERAGSAEDITVLYKFIQEYGQSSLPGHSEPKQGRNGPRLTEAQQIEEINRRTQDVLKGILSARGIFGGNPRYGVEINLLSRKVAKRSCWASDAVTLDKAKTRLAAAKELAEERSLA